MPLSHFPNLVSDFKILHALGNESKRKINQVFLVEHKDSGLKAVLKHLTKNSSKQHLEQFLRNEAYFSFDSSYLPKTLAFTETDKEILLIKTYSEGISLINYWKTIPNKLKEEFLVLFLSKFETIGRELLDLEIVHGDIKPTNIIIKGELLDFEISLIDFGLAFYPRKNSERNIIFSLGYSAPELILNRLDLASHASDLYSLGITFYHLYAGKLPLTHPNPAVMTNLQLNHPIMNHAGIPKNIFSLIEKCCAKIPFPKPPNRLTHDQITKLLNDGISIRFQNIGEILAAYHSYPKKVSFLNKLIKVFSKSDIKIKK